MSKRRDRGPYKRHTKRAPDDEKPPFEWQGRDYEILVAVLEHRFLTGELLQHLFPPDRGSGANSGGQKSPHSGSNLEKRLRKLYHHGFLDRLRPVRAGPIVYALAKKGAKLLGTKQLELPLPDDTKDRLRSFIDQDQLKPSIDWDEKNRTVTLQYIEHALMVSRFRVALKLAMSKTRHHKLETSQRASSNLETGTATVWRHNKKRVYINPDAFFVLRDLKQPEGKQKRAFFLEADRSTMDHGRMVTKFLHYYYLYVDNMHQRSYNVPSFRVLTVTKSKLRAEGLSSLLAGREHYLSFLQRLQPTKPLTKAQRTLADSLLGRTREIPRKQRVFFAFAAENDYQTHPENIFSSVWTSAEDPTKQTAIIANPIKRKT